MPAELVPLAPGVHYHAGVVNQLVVEDGAGGALIVDSGLDDSHARKLLRALNERNLQPVALLNTHSHADHYGGNAFITARHPGVRVFAPPFEEAVLRYPLLEPLYLFGARPPRELQGKFLMGAASVTELAPEEGSAEFAGVRVELVSVPGHAARMLAVRVGDVLFAADALFGPDALEKHPLTYCVDSAAQKASARRLGALAGVRVVLPGHGSPSENLAELVAVNVAAYERTTDAVREAARVPGTVDELLKGVCDALGVVMTSAANVVLNRSVVSAHLVELLEAGEVEMRVAENRLVFGMKTS